MTVVDPRAELISYGPVLGILGGMAEHPLEQRFAEMLGRSLAQDTAFRLCVSGHKGRVTKGDDGKLVPSFGYKVIQGAESVLTQAEREKRLLTRYGAFDPSSPTQFQTGDAQPARGLNPVSRGLSIISDADVLCLAGGSAGTKDYFQFARAIDKPVLPLPFLGGAAENIWTKRSEELASEYGEGIQAISDSPSMDLHTIGESGLEATVSAVIEALKTCVRLRCLVFMPFAATYDWVFNDIIKAAADVTCADVIRIDLESRVGDIIEMFRLELEQADCAVAVITGQSANVLYEIGYAHAVDLPVILLSQFSDAHSPEVDLPFYLRSHRTIWYPPQADVSGLAKAAAELGKLFKGLRIAPDTL